MSSQPDANFGGLPDVLFGTYDASNDYWGLYKLTIPSVPAGVSVTVKDAKLAVYLTDNTRNASQVITPYQATADWNEDTVTWNTRPGLSTIGTGLSFTGLGEINRRKRFQLNASVIQGWLQDSVLAQRGIVLKGSGSPGMTSLKTISSESFRVTDDLRPQLVLLLGVSVTDTAPPVITGLEAVDVGETAATVQWTTDEPADGLVEYGTTTGYGQAAPLQTARSTTHAVRLTGLTGQTTYHAHATSKDAAGNTSTSLDLVFVATGPMPGDLNHDGQLTAADVTALLAQLLGLSPVTPETADVNGDGRVSVADVQVLVNRL